MRCDVCGVLGSGGEEVVCLCVGTLLCASVLGPATVHFAQPGLVERSAAAEEQACRGAAAAVSAMKRGHSKGAKRGWESGCNHKDARR